MVKLYCMFILFRLGQLVTLAGLDGAPIPKLSRTQSKVSNGLHSGGQAPNIEIHGPSSESHAAFSQSDPDTVIRGPGHPAGRMVRPHILPQNYTESQDPTMQAGPIDTTLDGNPPSKFDELYQKVLRETEGALVNARGNSLDASKLSNSRAPSSRNTSGMDVTLTGVGERFRRKDRDPQDEMSDHSQGSHHSQVSHHSQLSQHSLQSLLSEHSKRSQGSLHSINSLQSLHSLPDMQVKPNNNSARSRSAGKENVPEQIPSSPEKSLEKDKDYTNTFEKSQSDISEDIEEIQEDIDNLDNSDEDDF